MTKRIRACIVLVAALACAIPLAVWAGGVDDRTATESAIATLEGDAHTKELCADPIAKAKLSLERGHRMRVAGDDRHARMVEGLALEWARVGLELARADALESKAAAARVLAGDAGAHVERERTTLEQHLAENGRLSADLAKAEAKDGGAK